MDWIINHCKQERDMLKKAPVALLGFTLIGFVLGYLYFSDRIDALKEDIERCSAKNAIQGSTLPDRRLTETQRSKLIESLSSKKDQIKMIVVASVVEPEPMQYGTDFVKAIRETGIEVNWGRGFLSPAQIFAITNPYNGIYVSVPDADNPSPEGREIMRILESIGIDAKYQSTDGASKDEYSIAIGYNGKND